MRLRNDYFPHRGASGVARAVAGFILALALAHPVEASEHALTRYGPFHFHQDAPQVIHLDGFLTPGAERAFQRLLTASGAAASVVLRSEGGNVRAALRIAREIDRRGLDTIVPPGAGCYSACAFLFLAGRNREALGELGVHQIASASENFESGQIAIAEVLEALFGFDTPGEVLVAMLRTPHSAIHVFERVELERLGLHRKRPPQASGRMQAAAGLPQAEREAKASEFVARLQRLWSRETGQALDDLRPHYALVVHYNGTAQSRDEVLASKAAEARRWPDRDLRADADSSHAICVAGECLVGAELEWVLRGSDPSVRLAGRSRVEYRLAIAGDGFLILSERATPLPR